MPNLKPQGGDFIYFEDCDIFGIYDFDERENYYQIGNRESVSTLLKFLHEHYSSEVDSWVEQKYGLDKESRKDV